MEGSHQKSNNWYRCRFVWNRGAVAADQAGHPRTLGVKEDLILGHLLDFMDRRLFGPECLRLLRHDLSRSVAAEWEEHDGELARLKREREQLDSSLRRQTLRLEEHDDPHHPVVAAAKDRIEELSSRRDAIKDAIQSLDARRPDGTRPDEIAALLNAVPDLRPTLRTASPDELVDVFDAFKVTVVFDKANRKLTLAATITPDLVPENEKTPTARGPVGEFVHSGGGILTHFPDRSYRFVEVRDLPS